MLTLRVNRKVGLAPDTRFRRWYAARETDINEGIPDAHDQANAEGGQEREAAAEHKNVASKQSR
jgi:hypothetical protein